MPIRWASPLLPRKSGGPPLIGYRAWCFSLDRVTPLIPLRWAPVASLPTVDIVETFGEAGWTGAESGWVSATCWRSSHVPQKIGGRCPCRQQVALGLRSSPCFDCDPHRVPGETCSCGFYAMKSLDALREPTEVNVILGKIAMAGKVIDHEFGYRAELARILALIPLEGTETDARVLASHLSLPLTKSVPPWPRRDRTA
jgi:hypothetical protein